MKTQLQKNKLLLGAKTKATKSLGLVSSATKNTYKKSPKIFLGVLALLVVAGGYTYFKKNEAKKETILVARGNLEEAVSVTGKIKASTDAELSFEKGGTVAAIYVKEGQKVYAGQTVAVLQGGTDYGQVLEARAGVAQALAQLDLVKNGTRREEVAVGKAGLGSAQTELQNAYASISDTLKSSYNTTSDAMRYRTQNFFSGTLRSGYTTEIITCNAALESSIARDRAQVERDLLAWGALDVTNSTDADKEQAILKAEGYLVTARALLENMNALVVAPCVANDARFDGQRAAVSAARQSLTQASSELTARKNALASSKGSITRAQSSLDLTSADTEPEKVRVQQAAVRQAYARLYSAQAASSKNVVTAPGNGIITKVDIAAGEYASPGKTVARLVGTGEFSVEADVTESDIARIVMGNMAKIVVPAIDAKEVFTGKIVSIDPAEQSSEGNPLYRIVVSLGTQDTRIKSGMTSETTIVTSTIENILRIPTRFLTKIKGVSKVNVVVDAKSLETEEREIKTGRKSTDGLVEILSGLEEGEILVLPVAPKK